MSTRRAPPIGIFTALLALAITPASLQSQVINSNGAGGGDWDVGASWNGGVAPGAGDDAVILGGDTITVADGDWIPVDNLTTDGNGLILDSPNIGAELAVTGTLTVNNVALDVDESDWLLFGSLAGTGSVTLSNADATVGIIADGALNNRIDLNNSTAGWLWIGDDLNLIYVTVTDAPGASIFTNNAIVLAVDVGSSLTLTGGATVEDVWNGGTLTLGGNATFADLDNAAGATVNLGGNLTAASVINAGTLNLGSGYTHTMTALTINAGGVLTGSGVINGPVGFNGSGQLRPGNSIGTITANSFRFRSTDTIFMEVGDGASSDRIEAVDGGTGTINFNRDDAGQTTIQINSLGTLSVGQHTYTLMTTDGANGFTSGSGQAIIADEDGVANMVDSGKTITGTADGLTNLSGYKIDLASGDVGTVELVSTQLDAAAGIFQLTINVLAVSNWAPNEIAASRVVTRLANAGHAEALGIKTVLNGLSGDARQDALNQLTPAASTALPAMSMVVARRFRGITGDRMNSIHRSVALRENGTKADRMLAMADPDLVLLGQSPDGDCRQTWFESFGNWADQGAVADNALRGYSVSSFGFGIGADQLVSRNVLLGIAAGGAWSDVAVRDTGHSRGTADNFMVDLYGSWFMPNEMYVNASIGYQFSNYTFDRILPAFGETAHGSHQGNMLLTSTEIGRELCVGQLHVTPFLGLDYLTLREGSYTETGAANANLAIDANTTTAWLQTLGMRFSKQFCYGRGWVVEPQLSVAWVHDYGDAQLLSVGRFAFDTGNSQPFTTTGYPTHRNRARLDAGAHFVFNHSVDGHLNYTAEFANRFGSHTLEAGLIFKF